MFAGELSSARGLIVLSVLAATGACDSGPDPMVPVEPPPTAGITGGPIIVVTIDTLRADHLGAYGYVRETSPNLDALAREGILFEQAYSTAGTTRPAHASIFTSLYPMQTGITSNQQSVAASGARRGSFLQEELLALGYETGGFVSATPVKAQSGLDAGMETWAEPARGVPQRPGSETTDLALEWLASRTGSAFFLWVHYFDPHSPHESPEDVSDVLGPSDVLADFQRERGLGLDPGLAFLNDAYDGEIRFVDGEVARLLDAVREGGWYDDATIVVVSDHGEGLGQHDRLGHGRIYQEILHVPLIMKFPGQFELHGTRQSSPVSVVDVVPTLVETLELEVGADFVAQFEGVNAFDAAARGRQLFAQRTSRSRPDIWGPGEKFVIFDGRWKLHESTQVDDELYDLLEDPHELTNVLAQNPGVGDRMRDQLGLLLERFSVSDMRLNSDSEVPDEILNELRALGYIQ